MTTAPEVVSATAREGKFNKNAARRVRVQGKIPGVIYGAKEPAQALELDPKQMQRILLVGVRPQHDFRCRDCRRPHQGHDRRLAV